MDATLTSRTKNQCGAAMKIERANLATCGNAVGLVVVIDVIRAFTVASFAFASGVEDIILVSTIEEALELKQKNPTYFLAGEVEGIPIPGFEFGNSPGSFLGRDMRGTHLIQRTTCGTQGVARSVNASGILVAGLCNAAATARYISAHPHQSLTLVESGVRDGGWGDEDVACADLIEALLLDKEMDRAEIIRRVKFSPTGRKFDGSNALFPACDIGLATDFDRFDFAMVVKKNNGLQIAKPVPA
jgi:2-phosphosulfolactate phosphatase